MLVDEHFTTSNSLAFYWASPRNLSLEYMPSICESRMINTCVNKTWISETNYKFTQLKPFTSYNMTVYVRLKDMPSIIYPSAYYVLSSTAEGGMFIKLNR